MIWIALVVLGTVSIAFKIASWMARLDKLELIILDLVHDGAWHEEGDLIKKLCSTSSETPLNAMVVIRTMCGRGLLERYDSEESRLSGGASQITRALIDGRLTLEVEVRPHEHEHDEAIETIVRYYRLSDRGRKIRKRRRMGKKRWSFADLMPTPVSQ